MALLDSLLSNVASFVTTPFALDTAIVLIVAGLLIGLTRKGFTYHNGALVPRDMGPRWEQIGYAIMFVGLALFVSANGNIVASAAGVTNYYSGGTGFRGSWYCLNPVFTLVQNCAYVSSTNSTLCTTTNAATAGGNCNAGPNACNRSTNATACSGVNSVVLSQFGPALQLENMVHGQQYCMGASTSALTLRSSSPNLLVSGALALRDMNVTNAVILLSLTTSTTAIASGFALGSCGSGGFSVSVCSFSFLLLNTVEDCSGATGRSSTFAAGSTIYLGFQVQVVSGADVQVKTSLANAASYSLLMQEQA